MGEFVAMYRLEYKNREGGANGNRIIEQDNKICFVGQPLYLSDFEHHVYYARRKKDTFYKCLTPDSFFAQKTVFIPDWIDELIKEFVISQFKSGGDKLNFDKYKWYAEKYEVSNVYIKDCRSKSPKLVDPNIPGTALQLESPWTKLLELVCAGMCEINCNSKKEFDNIFTVEKTFDDASIVVKDYVKDCTSEEFSSLFARCSIGPSFTSDEQTTGTEKLFKILDKYDVEYDREAIFEAQNEYLSRSREMKKYQDEEFLSRYNYFEGGQGE